MIGVTVFGLLFTPVFYVVCRKLAARRKSSATALTESGDERIEAADKSLVR